MTSPKLLEVGARLEKTVQRLVSEASSNMGLYDTYEMVAIQILDSEFENFHDDELEQYLMEFLETKKQ